MIDATLCRSCTYRHPAGRIRRIETHISVIYLAERHAYKINKPVVLGFADFTRLTTRQRCCEDEVRSASPNVSRQAWCRSRAWGVVRGLEEIDA